MINDIRARIDELDRQLVDLLAERMRLSLQLGIEKSKLDMAIVDGARERAVRQLWKEMFSKNGLSPSLADGMLDALLRESRHLQLRARKPADVMIVGEGRMGSLLQRCLADAGNRVAKVSAEGAANAYAGQEFVVLAVPPEAQLDMSFARGAIVMDIASSKSLIFRRLERQSEKLGFRYVSTHPLFGAVEDPFEETVVVIPSRTSGEGLTSVKDLWRSAGFRVVVSSVEEHERAMSAVQVMVHAHLLSLMSSLNQFAQINGIDPYRYETRTLRRLRPILDDLSKNERVVREIREQNSYAKEALALSRKAFNRVAGGELA
ncbi:prephenate dehydrogenase/arogenate dehydrogenase family protein [Tardisphaera saccharovorans]